MSIFSRLFKGKGIQTQAVETAAAEWDSALSGDDLTTVGMGSGMKITGFLSFFVGATFLALSAPLAFAGGLAWFGSALYALGSVSQSTVRSEVEAYEKGRDISLPRLALNTFKQAFKPFR